ncbi:tail terminator [Mycobacterium phage LittleE]|uniref:Tail terminator n=1 Tax=Mycobacterium phage LittleE TaxID=2922212 RepID=G1D3R1_9CAUD|nr:tail terminator [Mycobacterium phage LittleE]AEK09410.1 tail terminator [Mycobacterium phage LittleE]
MTEYEYPPGVKVLIKWLSGIEGVDVRHERPPNSPLPFISVHRISGGEDENCITDQGRYAFMVFGSSQEMVDDTVRLVTRRMKKLVGYGSQEKVTVGDESYYADKVHKREERPIDNLDDAIPRKFFGTSLMYDVHMRIVAA